MIVTSQMIIWWIVCLFSNSLNREYISTWVISVNCVILVCVTERWHRTSANFVRMISCILQSNKQMPSKWVSLWTFSQVFAFVVELKKRQLQCLLWSSGYWLLIEVYYFFTINSRFLIQLCYQMPYIGLFIPLSTANWVVISSHVFCN